MPAILSYPNAAPCFTQRNIVQLFSWWKQLQSSCKARPHRAKQAEVAATQSVRTHDSGSVRESDFHSWMLNAKPGDPECFVQMPKHSSFISEPEKPSCFKKSPFESIRVFICLHSLTEESPSATLPVRKISPQATLRVTARHPNAETKL